MGFELGMRDDDDKEPDALPFSPETLATFQKLQRATSKDERLRLTLELAQRFAAEHDPSDSSATDDYHLYFEELAKAKLAYEQAATKVGRLASECIKEFLNVQPVAVEDVAPDAASKSLN